MAKIEWLISKEKVEYTSAVATMEKRVADIVAGNKSELVWFVEHPPLYTAGTSAKKQDLIEVDKFPVYESGRGGEYTYHGPGQRVVYVMLDLKKRDMQDIKAYVFNLEKWIITSLSELGIKGERRKGRVGIWIDLGGGVEKKIAAIGIRVRKWVTYHGIAINVNPDLSHFSGIVPCGISQYGVTSLHDLKKNISMAEIDTVLKKEFCNVFSVE